MDTPPQFVVVLFIALVVCLGPAMIVMGLRAYSGRWTSWLTFTAQSTAKHSRAGFVTFWGGLGITGCFLLIGLQEIGIKVPGFQVLCNTIWGVCLAIAMMHQFFLPKFLRPVLLPQWYRDWEAEQFEWEAREGKRRRARRQLRRENRRRAREQGALPSPDETAPEETPLITVEVDGKVIWPKTRRP